MQNKKRQNLEGLGDGNELHQQILAEGRDRFPEESYQQLLRVGASPEEALGMLGYTADRKQRVNTDADNA